MKENQTIFMTGATSGLGKVSALQAAKKGATLIILARSKEKGEALKNELKNQNLDSPAKIEIIEGNLNSFESIVSACDQVKSKFPVIDMVINNAGIMNFEYKESVDKIEETLQVNLLSPLLVCHLLFDNLKQSKEPKIIFTSSALHKGEINFSNIEFRDSFSSFKVYSQSKLGVILICRLLAKTLEQNKINIYSLHPGVVRTELGKDAGWFTRVIFNLMGKSPEKGARTLSFLIETPNSELKNGEYYAKEKLTSTTKESYNLDTAQKLLNVAKTYLKDHLKNDSPIFN